MRLKKCTVCGDPIPATEDPVPFKGKYVHSKCFALAMKLLSNEKQEKLAKKAEEKQNNKSKTKKTKPINELKDGLSDEEYNEKMLVVNYAKQLLEVETLPTSFFAILSNEMTKYGYTYSGVYQTLKYLYDIKEREISDNILGLVPYYYDEAQAFFAEVQKVAEKNAEKNVNSMYKEKVVVIKPKERVIKQLPFD